MPEPTLYRRYTRSEALGSSPARPVRGSCVTASGWCCRGADANLLDRFRRAPHAGPCRILEAALPAGKDLIPF
jgi:hypothetical protein